MIATHTGMIETALRRVCAAACSRMVLPFTGVGQDDRWVSAADARQHKGDRDGVRFGPTSPGQPTFLNFGPPFPNQTMTVVVWGDVRARFDPPPERLYRDRRVCVTGIVAPVPIQPQIVVDNPTAIRAVATGGCASLIRMMARDRVHATLVVNAAFE